MARGRNAMKSFFLPSCFSRFRLPVIHFKIISDLRMTWTFDCANEWVLAAPAAPAAPAASVAPTAPASQVAPAAPVASVS